jgi:DNA polymerase I-like protein with 3'-5' exonuclease and polymerase domains
VKSDFVPADHKWLRLDDQSVATYNCWDTWTTAQLVGVMDRVLQTNNQLDFYRRWFTTLAPVIDHMQARGVGVLDVAAQKTYRAALRKELDEVEAPILGAASFLSELEVEAHRWHEDTLREHPTWEKKAAKGLASRLRKAKERRSGFFNRAGEGGVTDLGRLLFDHFGFKPAPPTRDRPARSTAQDALIYVLQHRRAKDEPNLWVLENLLHRTRLNTILTRYMTVEADWDGRVRPLIKMGGTETLRLAYAGDAGEALQQWPAEARHVVVPADGCIYVARDYSQVEARLMAILSDDTPMLEAFSSGEDVHVQNAVDLGLTTLDAWPSLPPDLQMATRNFAKTFIYGLGYGGAAETMKTKTYCPCPRCRDKVPQTLALTRDQIRAAADRWAEKHHRILTWRSALVESIKGPGGDHTWTSPFGYRRFFLEPRGEAERSIYNYPMQHCSAMIMTRAMVELDKAGFPAVLQMHDEYMGEVPVGDVNRWLGVMREVMEAPVKELGGWVFPTKGATGQNWGACK